MQSIKGFRFYPVKHKIYYKDLLEYGCCIESCHRHLYYNEIGHNLFAGIITGLDVNKQGDIYFNLDKFVNGFRDGTLKYDAHTKEKIIKNIRTYTQIIAKRHQSICHHKPKAFDCAIRQRFIHIMIRYPERELLALSEKLKDFLEYPIYEMLGRHLTQYLFDRFELATEAPEHIEECLLEKLFFGMF